MPSNVRLTLKGLLVLAAKEGQPTGKVGILYAPPPPANPDYRHELTITITKEPPTGPSQTIVLTRPNIRRDLSLQLTNAAPQNIAIRNRKPVNRHIPPVQHDSFRWFVDLEGSELYAGPIGVDPAGFESILTFNGGALFTADKPNESILRHKPSGAGSYSAFGRVGLTLGVDFLSATSVVFKNGADTVFDSASEAGTDYTIEIVHDARLHPPIVEDANHYYTAVGTTIDPTDRILFMSISEVRLLQERLEAAKLNENTELERGLEAAIAALVKLLDFPAGPEAACFTAYLSQTPIP